MTVPLSQRWSEVAPALMSCDLQSDSGFTFSSHALSTQVFSVHLVFVLSSVKDISCSGSHRTGRAKVTSRWSLMYPQELCFFPSPPCRAIYSSSLLAGSRGHFQLYTVWIWPMPEDTLGMLSALVWNAGSCCWSRWPSWVPAPLLLTSKKRFDLLFCEKHLLHQGDGLGFRSS